MSSAAIDLLRLHWGYDSFRPLQQEIIDSVLSGKDTLALLPTGGGKSICYQIPALLKDGVCLVISPLIALMNDQVAQLQERGIAASALHSALPYPELDRLLENATFGNTKLLYLSPERLKTDLAIERIKRMQINLIAVDEAHCISQWGYDFRPPYLEIAEIRKWLPGVPVLALTATATPEVVQDIQDKLAFPAPNVLRKSFERKNLSYIVRHTENKEEKLLEILQKVKGTAVVYTRNRRQTKETALRLHRKGISATFYHAGLDPQEREKRQAQWMKGEVRVIVATNAFGMGIDKSDVRLVVHLGVPDSLEAYFQEAGRAGRDEKSALAVLLYRPSDRFNLENQLEIAFPNLQQLKQTYRALCNYFQLAMGSPPGTPFDFDLNEFCKRFDLPMSATFHSLRILEKEGWISLSDAVYQPSRLQFLATKEELYDYQLKHPSFDPILKTILRTYQGAFQQHIKLREGQLANFLHLKRTELQRALEIMHKDQILEYIPQKDKPQLVFLKERVQADNFRIDMTAYEARKEKQARRVAQMLDYAEGEHCRSRFLLAYFGESSGSECGQCDYCRSRKVPRLDRKQFENLTQIVNNHLLDHPQTIQHLLTQFPEEQHSQLMNILEHLLENGRIIRKGRLLQWKK